MLHTICLVMGGRQCRMGSVRHGSVQTSLPFASRHKGVKRSPYSHSTVGFFPHEQGFPITACIRFSHSVNSMALGWLHPFLYFKTNPSDLSLVKALGCDCVTCKYGRSCGEDTDSWDTVWLLVLA